MPCRSSRADGAAATVPAIDAKDGPGAEPGLMRIRGEGRPGKRLRRELERLRRVADA